MPTYDRHSWRNAIWTSILKGTLSHFETYVVSVCGFRNKTWYPSSITIYRFFELNKYITFNYFTSASAIWWCSVNEQFSIRWLSAYYLSKWGCIKGYYWERKVGFLLWSWHWNRQRGNIKTILQQTKRGDSNIQFTFHLLNSYFKCFFPKCESSNFCKI